MSSTQKFLEDSLSEEELQNLRERNKYLQTLSGKLHTFDAVDVLSGEIPEFKNQGERFTCVIEVAQFVEGCKGDLGSLLGGLNSFINLLSADMKVMFIQQLTPKTVDALYKSNKIEAFNLQLLEDVFRE